MGKSTSEKSMGYMTLTGFGNLIKLLPTGTVFLFQFFNPVLTNNGKCHVSNKYLSGALIGFCGLSCFFSSFTDSYTGTDGITHYGIATFKGIWPTTSSGSVNTSSYKIRPGDFVQALFSLIVFGVVSLLDSNTVDCFYPSFESNQKALLMALPPAIGAISSAVFVLFPNTRHGIGYPPSSSKSSNDS
ncbi:Protocadherin-15 like [Actinidia chinensis var. chinensis]|uniref:Protocadherin-15 like n=1 Tax=Actinidia chinensis var. chinensis TaxID=1590841 RepID=A0A2R6Q3L1_ACTCC|nr:Protocadherin-15 like [Actinidia chinensis var. chinensis]